jgi:hypothetical protein
MLNFFTFNKKKQDLLLVFFGESNSGGFALNSNATALELSRTKFVQIWDNTNNDGFENLDIGTNNLIGHTGLTNGATHGWELQFANKTRGGAFKRQRIYLCKTGQGGSKVADWLNGNGYWQTFITRTTGAMQQLPDASIYVCFSLGINDAIAGTNAATFYTNLTTLCGNIRTQLGSVDILATGIMRNNSNYEAIDDKITEMAAANSWFKRIDIAGAGLRDSNHWNYEGMKLIADRMMSFI